MNENTTTVDRNEKIWAESNTGTRMHAFVQSGTDGNLRAMCRSTIERSTKARYVGKDEAFLICARCVKLANAMWDRAEASLEQADPYSDGFHTVDETTADANRETEKKPATIPADMNRELLRQSRAVAEVHKRLFLSDIDATHAEALAEDEARTKAAVLDLAHRNGVRVESISMVDGELLVVTETSEDAVRLRALRSIERRLRTVEADHEEALKMDYERDTWRVRKMAIVIEADHEEALKMNRAWDKSVAGYAHHYDSGADVVRRPAAPALRNDSPLQNLRRFLDQD